MIPKNITDKEIIKAINEIDVYGIPKNRNSTKYLIKHNNSFYPPKYVLSIANKLINGQELSPSNFNGGNETNNFLKKLGFTIVNGKNNI